MRKEFLSVLCVLGSLFLTAQELSIKETLINPSSQINDGQIEVEVSGGNPPYIYKWSNQSTPLKSAKSTGLTEGVEYTLSVTDSHGKSVTETYEIKAESITEIFNGFMTPAVSALGSVLFWDPFAATGIYNPITYADVKLIPIPGWSAGIDEKFILDQWLVAEGDHVDKGQDIAIVSKSTGETITVTALAAGTLKYRVEEGGVIYNSENTQHVVEEGAHNLAEIKYDEPIPLLHPNGDFQTTSIPFIVIWLICGALFFTLRMGFINFRGFKHALDLAK